MSVLASCVTTSPIVSRPVVALTFANPQTQPGVSRQPYTLQVLTRLSPGRRGAAHFIFKVCCGCKYAASAVPSLRPMLLLLRRCWVSHAAAPAAFNAAFMPRSLPPLATYAANVANATSSPSSAVVFFVCFLCVLSETPDALAFRACDRCSHCRVVAAQLSLRATVRPTVSSWVSLASGPLRCSAKALRAFHPHSVQLVLTVPFSRVPLVLRMSPLRLHTRAQSTHRARRQASRLRRCTHGADALSRAGCSADVIRPCRFRKRG